LNVVRCERIREEILEQLGVSVTEAAKVLDGGRAAALSAEMALRIEKAFGAKMETLLNIQAWHDAYIMRRREHEIAIIPYSLAEPPIHARTLPTAADVCGSR
jgi:antitoxin HigA-1